MKALVQMLTNGEGTQFVATTEADDDGLFWWFIWGDGTAAAFISRREAQECDQRFLDEISRPPPGWSCDGKPMIVPSPDIQECEDQHAWASRAMSAIEAFALSRHLVEAGTP